MLVEVQRSVGYISQTLQEAGTAAAAYNAKISIPLAVLGEADEIFQGRRPCLTVVDGRSFLVLNLRPAETRDKTDWGLAFLNLQERGIQFHDLVSDGAKGIRAGAEEAQLDVPLRPDLFHLLRDSYQLSQQMERAAYRAIKTAERARRAKREAAAPKRRVGCPLEIKTSLEEAERQEDQAIYLYDAWSWLFHEMRRALDPIDEAGRLTAASAARSTVEAAIALLQELEEEAITAFAQALLDQLDELVAPLAWLEEQLSLWREGLSKEWEALIMWAWQHREVLELAAGEGFPADLQPVVRAFWDALSLFHCASSLAESLHSWVRTYLQRTNGPRHRGMPQWLRPLLELYWNHHRFSRGKRERKSPLELAGVEDAPSLSEVLDQVLNPPSQDKPEPATQSDPHIDFAPQIRIELQVSVEPAQEAVA